MRQKQRGVTMIGWIFLLTPMALVLYAGIRVAPEYLNYYKVVQAMEKTKTQVHSDEAKGVATISSTLAKQFDIGFIDKPNVSEMVVGKGENGWEITADYESMVPLFGNLHLLMVFKKTIVIGN